MKSLVFLILIGAAYYVHSEPCNILSDCVHTLCATSGSSTSKPYLHVACKEQQCTCEEDKKLCLIVDECNHGRCIGNLGALTQWHCVDGYCQCVQI